MNSTNSQVRGTGSTSFRQFLFANLALRVGGRIWMLAMPIIAIEYLAADSLQVGYLASAATVCYLLFGLPAGVWIDRMMKRRVMILSAVIRALLLTSVPVVWLLGSLSFSYLCVAALLAGICSLFYDIAHQSYIPLLVGADASYTANARLETTTRAVNAASPALVGLVMTVVSAPLLVLLDGLGYLVCAAMLWRLPEVEEKRSKANDRSLSKELVEGVQFVWHQPALRIIAIAVALSNFFATMIATMIPILVLSSLGLGVANLGMVYTAAECGGLLGALLLGTLRRKFGIGKLLAGGLIVAATFTALVPVALQVTTDRPLLAQAVLMISMYLPR